MSLNGFLGCQSGLKCTDKGFVQHPLSRFRDVICPKPRRVRAPFTSDSLDRCLCMPKRNFSFTGGDSSHEISDFFNLLNGDDFYGSDRQAGLYSCSPPLRTENPIVHDIHFLSQASQVDFPFGSAHEAVLNAAREKGHLCVETSVNEPVIWIEECSCWIQTSVFLHLASSASNRNYRH